MREEVFHRQGYSVGHSINKQLLLSLEDIFKQYNSNASMKLNVECNNSTRYKFNSIDECFDYFSKKPFRIVEMEIIASFGEWYESNKITLTFNNKKFASTEIQFQFDNSDDYLVLKNKIELCLKNFRINYRVLSIIPIVPTLLTVIFIWLCVYTGIRNIIFPKVIQDMIVYSWILGSIIIGIFPPFVKIKRNIFPCTEFRIGQNELVENRNSTIRNFIISTLIIGTILGVAVNVISDFLF